MKATAALLKLVFLTLAFTATGGCTRATSKYTVDYYLTNDEEREAKLKECANDPGAFREDALCINAQSAGARKSFGSLRATPSMTLLEAQELREREQVQRETSRER